MVSSSADVRVEIDRDGNNGVFSNHDIISGKVQLNVMQSLSLNYIQVKLEGISKTELSLPKDSRRNNPKREKEKKEKIYQDVHKLLYDTTIVFPPPDMRDSLLAKEYTLTQGSYTYPFQFKIPLDNACIKLEGLTNKVSFDKKSFNVVINNGNFNLSTLRTGLLDEFLGKGGPSEIRTQQQTEYHCTEQLPPTFSIGECASVRYFVKVTCKRSSFLKPNLRSFDPFLFVPIDLDKELYGSGYRELFVRKEMSFMNGRPSSSRPTDEAYRNRKNLPQPPPPNQKRGLLRGILNALSTPPPTAGYDQHSTPIRSGHEQLFALEIRLSDPASLIPSAPPTFSLFLVTNDNPSRFVTPSGTSNGKGILYLQKISADLNCTTIVSVLKSDTSVGEIHKAQHQETITICNNSYSNVKFDLKDAKTVKGGSGHEWYELEVPRRFYESCVVPPRVTPSFHTCNITRSYDFTFSAGFSMEPLRDTRDKTEVLQKVNFVDLVCNNIKVRSGYPPTSRKSSTYRPPPPPEETKLHAPRVAAPPTASRRPSSQSALSEKQQLEQRYQQTPHHERQGLYSNNQPPLPSRPLAASTPQVPFNADDIGADDYDVHDESEVGLPSYDDVVRNPGHQ